MDQPSTWLMATDILAFVVVMSYFWVSRAVENALDSFLASSDAGYLDRMHKFYAIQIFLRPFSIIGVVIILLSGIPGLMEFGHDFAPLFQNSPCPQ